MGLTLLLVLSTAYQPFTKHGRVRAVGRRAQPALDCSFHACTVATHEDGYFRVLQAACEQHNVPLAVLGFGEPWGGWKWRAERLVEFLGSLPHEDVVLIVDGFDCVLLQDAEVILSRYVEFGKPVVFGCAEKARVDRVALSVWYGTCMGENLNAGGCIGRAWALLELWRTYLDAYGDERDDQRALTRICQETPLFRERPGVAFDVDGRIFYNAGRTLRPGTAFGLRINNGRWESARTGAQPCILHAVGGGDMRPLLAAAGYDISAVTQRNYAMHILENEPQRALLLIGLLVSMATATGLRLAR